MDRFSLHEAQLIERAFFYNAFDENGNATSNEYASRIGDWYSCHGFIVITGPGPRRSLLILRNANTRTYEVEIGTNSGTNLLVIARDSQVCEQSHIN